MSRTNEPRDPALRYAVVVPTVGRPSLVQLLRSLAEAGGPVGDDPNAPDEVIVVDDRRPGAAALPALPSLPPVGGRTPRLLRAGGRGPAAARNLGWRAATCTWVAFLDDDVELPGGWTSALVDDIAACGPRVAGTQGRLRVPLPADRRPTDFERGTAGLERAAWITADMAYRTEALLDVGGFDERFPRAYREDADLALRVREAGWDLRKGGRVAHHPVRAVGDWYSVRVQAGNADDALMRALHGPRWRELAGVPRGRLRRHVLLTGAATTALGGLLTGRPRTAASAGLVWAGLTTELVTRRVAPGPRPGQPGWAAEWRRMLLTSLVLPWVAVYHRLCGQWRWRRGAPEWPPPVEAVLLDRDGTLVQDVPYNGDPTAVRPMPGAVEAVQRLRDAGLKVGVVTNQSGIGRGLVTPEQVQAVNARVEALFGRFDTWQVCPHAPGEGCDCRKPAAALVRQGARALGVRPESCAVVGDIGSDVEAALAAGARPVLVPTEVTRREEIADAPVVATSLGHAVDLLLTRHQLVTEQPRREGATAP